MVPEILEKILNLFFDYYSQGKPLEINIDPDLIQILPLPWKLVLDLLTNEPINAISRLSNDQKKLLFQNNLSLCSINENHGDTCPSLTCQQLHICRDYLLNNNCSQFKSSGQCSRSHSLSTKHNEMILKKFNLLSDDQQIFQFVCHLTCLSTSLKSSTNQSKITIQSINKQNITDDLIDHCLGEHQALLIDQKLIDPFTVELIFDDDEIVSMMENFITTNHSHAVLVKKNPSSDILLLDDSVKSNTSFDRQWKIIPMESKNVSQSDNDFHQETPSNNRKSTDTLNETFSNRLKINDSNNINLSKSSSEHPIMTNFGRGRGRPILNATPTVSSFSRETSSEDSTKTLSRNQTPRFLPPNRQSADLIPNFEKKISFSQRLHSKINEQFSSPIQTKSADSSSSSTPDPIVNTTNQTSDHFSHQDKIESTDSSDTSSRHFLPKFRQKQENKNEIHTNNDSLSSNVSDEMVSPTTSQNVTSKSTFVLRRMSSVKNTEKSSISTGESNLITYTYTKPFTDEHLCYLLGPGRQKIDKKNQYQVLSCLPSGFCRVTNIEQGKEIEKQLYSILSDKLNVKVIKTNDDLALLICSSAAENLFQQNQTNHAIISEPTKVRLNIEVIDTPTIERKEASSISTKRTTTSSTEQPSSDGKFYISATNSSIDVVSGDISQIPVDMMICISTSHNLRDSVLRHAGSTIETQYNDRHSVDDALLLDGGLTRARKILFVPWQTDVEPTETIKTKKSLSDLVKWCIEEAHRRKMKLISFPPIGTGQLALDPGFVSETIISAASEHLHQFEMNVVFVIYSSTGINQQDECYQVFRIYLDSLCAQMVSSKVSTSTINNEKKNFDTKKQQVKRDIQSKRLVTLSDSRNIDQYISLLIKSLEQLMFEKTFDLSLIEPSFITQMNVLIDLCLQKYVLPRIDLSRNELTICGDRDSCFQCFYNLREGKKVHQYSYVTTENGEKTDENKFNLYTSLKIDEALAVGETNIRIESDYQMIVNIDLTKLQLQINKDKQSYFLVKKQLNDSKIKLPSSWSSSLLMIQTVDIPQSSYESLKCFRIFYETMSKSDWQIERIDSIENSPLYIHYLNKKKEESKLYFHGCSYSSIQSIIHYGFHSINASDYGEQFEKSSIGSICFTRDALNSHLYGTRHSTDGKHYLFAVEIAKNNTNDQVIFLSNNDAHLALPLYLIAYQRRRNFR